MKTASVTRISKNARGGQLRGRGGKVRRGTPVDGADNRHRMDVAQPAGMFGVHTAPSREAWRASVVDRVCPVCLQGPYKVLALHTHSAHGISAAELKELAGLVKKASTAAPDVTAANSVRGREQASIRRPIPPRGPKQLSEAGRVSLRRNMLKARSHMTPEQLAEAQAKGRATTVAKAAPFAGRRRVSVPCVACGTLHDRYRKTTCSETCRIEMARRGGLIRKQNHGDTCVKGHTYDGVKSNGARACSQCNQEYQAAYRTRKRAALEPLTDRELAQRRAAKVKAGRAGAVARARKKALQDHIKRVVDAAPPLTSDQKAKLAILLR